MAYYNFNNAYGESMRSNYYHRVCRASNFDEDGVPTIASKFGSALASISLPHTYNPFQYDTIVRNLFGTYFLFSRTNRDSTAISIYKRNRTKMQAISYVPTYVPSTTSPKLSVYSDSSREFCTFDTNPVNFGLNILRTYSIPLSSASFIDLPMDLPHFIVGDLRSGEALMPLEGQHYTTETYDSSGGGLWIRRVYVAVYKRTPENKLVFRFKEAYSIQGTQQSNMNHYPTVLRVAIVSDRADPDYVVSHL